MESKLGKCIFMIINISSNIVEFKPGIYSKDPVLKVCVLNKGTVGITITDLKLYTEQ